MKDIFGFQSVTDLSTALFKVVPLWEFCVLMVATLPLNYHIITHCQELMELNISAVDYGNFGFGVFNYRTHAINTRSRLESILV